MATTTILPLLAVLFVQAVAEKALVSALDSAGPDAAAKWQPVNDGVMGCVSSATSTQRVDGGSKEPLTREPLTRCHRIEAFPSAQGSEAEISRKKPAPGDELTDLSATDVFSEFQYSPPDRSCKHSPPSRRAIEC